MRYYISSCVFTERFPELSRTIRRIAAERWGLEVVRCCVPGWKKKAHEDMMPAGELYDEWRAIPHSAVFKPDDEIYSLCANCINIADEWRAAQAHSIWELVAADEGLVLPDYSGLTATLQDCWRVRDRPAVHEAVRTVLDRMHVSWVEAPHNREESDFCGTSLYKPQVARNPRLAPRHYKDGCDGLFEPHTGDEQVAIMRSYCAQYATETVICYCHYCLKGYVAAGVDGRHLAQLVFGSM